MAIRHTYSVLTAHRAKLLGLRPTRHYGYVIRISPPIEHTSTGEDVEGIGWVPHPERKHLQHLSGWYMRKALAERRAAALNK